MTMKGGISSARFVNIACTLSVFKCMSFSYSCMINRQDAMADGSPAAHHGGQMAQIERKTSVDR